MLEWASDKGWVGVNRKLRNRPRWGSGGSGAGWQCEPAIGVSAEVAGLFRKIRFVQVLGEHRLDTQKQNRDGTHHDLQRSRMSLQTL